MEQIEECPDEGDDEGGDDDEEEEVIVAKTKVVAHINCLSRSCTCHTDDAKNLEREFIIKIAFKQLQK